jgi:hypothetical protein
MSDLDNPLSPERLRMAAETLEAVRARGRQLASAMAEAAGGVRRFLASPEGRQLAELMEAGEMAAGSAGADFPP